VKTKAEMKVPNKQNKEQESRPQKHYEETLIAALGLRAELKEKPQLYFGAVAWTVLGIALTLFFTIFFGILSIRTWWSDISWLNNLPSWLYILSSFILAVAFVAFVFFLVMRFRQPLLICINRLIREPINKPLLLPEEKNIVEMNDSSPESTEKLIERMAADIANIKNKLADNERTAWYHFRYALGFAATAIGVGFSYASPIVGGIPTKIIAALIVAFGLAIMFIANVEYKPNYFRQKVAIIGTVVMLVGVLLVVVVSFTNIPQILQIKLVGMFIFAIGIIVMIFSRRSVKSIG